jgi:hypothetical protein
MKAGLHKLFNTNYKGLEIECSVASYSLFQAFYQLLVQATRRAYLQETEVRGLQAEAGLDKVEDLI